MEKGNQLLVPVTVLKVKKDVATVIEFQGRKYSLAHEPNKTPTKKGGASNG